VNQFATSFGIVTVGVLALSTALAHETHAPLLEEVVVYGRAQQSIGAAGSASEGLVGYQDIRLPPLLRVGELVEAVPGMVATQHSGTGKANQYFLRGFNLDHGTDFSAHANGVPLNMRTHGHGHGYLDLNFLIPELVATTSYRKGPYHADVGDFSSAGSVDFGFYERLPETLLSATVGEDDYLRALEAAAPDRMQVRSYGESWQGRALVYAVIGSPENMARLDEIQDALADVGDGEAPADDLPAVVWLSYSVHGDEITPADSALFMAYHLLAAEDDELVDTILANTIVIIDPVQNPDGRERFIHSFTSALGLKPMADRYTAEHDQPWPRGRFNHYLFDLNRDWFALTQPETIGKVQALLDWHPVVFVDAHEMGGDATYYFPPAARPFNPNITEAQKDNQVQLGRSGSAGSRRLQLERFQKRK